MFPYIGAGLGIAFVNASALGGYNSSTNFAYQGMVGVIGRGEQGLLVQTGDGVREPQNRRVEIVIQ